MDRWNSTLAERSLGAGSPLITALRLGLPFAERLLPLAGGSEDLLQELWIAAAQTEMGRQAEEPSPDQEEQGAPLTYIGSIQAESKERAYSFLLQLLKKLKNKERRKDRNMRKLDSSWSFVTSKGDNGWP